MFYLKKKQLNFRSKNVTFILVYRKIICFFNEIIKIEI